MKKNDLAAIVVIIAISGVIAYFLANAWIGAPENSPVPVEKVTPIGGSFPKPDERVFNDKAFDPTVDIDTSGNPTDRLFGD